MTEGYKKILSNYVYNVCVEMLLNKEEFNILLDNHNNWNMPLPENLRKEKQFSISINQQTLDDSYIDDNGNIVINTMFGDEEYSKVLENADISGLMDKSNKIVLCGKQFREVPQIDSTTTKQKIPSEEAVHNSMSYFKKNNPEMFS